MGTVVFSSQAYEEAIYTEVSKRFGYEVTYIKESLCEETAGAAAGIETVCVTPRDELRKKILEILAAGGTKNIVMRSLDLSSVDLHCAERLGLKVEGIPPVPAAVYAEYIVGVLLFLLRGLGKVQDGVASVRSAPGRSLRGKRVLLVGDDDVVAEGNHLLSVFPCTVEVLNPAEYAKAEDVVENLKERLPDFDIVVVHCTYRKETVGMFSEQVVMSLKPGALVVSTGWTEFIDFAAFGRALDKGMLSGLGVDVRENGFFMHQIEAKPQLIQLLHHPKVFISFDQAPYTVSSIEGMAEDVFRAITDLERRHGNTNEASIVV